MEMGSQHRAPAALPPEKTGYPLYRSLMGLRAGLDGHGKSLHHRDSTHYTPVAYVIGMCVCVCVCCVVCMHYHRRRVKYLL